MNVVNDGVHRRYQSTDDLQQIGSMISFNGSFKRIIQTDHSNILFNILQMLVSRIGIADGIVVRRYRFTGGIGGKLGRTGSCCSLCSTCSEVIDSGDGVVGQVRYVFDDGKEEVSVNGDVNGSINVSVNVADKVVFDGDVDGSVDGSVNRPVNSRPLMYRRFVNPRDEILKIAVDLQTFNKDLIQRVNDAKRLKVDLDVALIFCNSYHGTRYDLGECAINDGLLVYDSLTARNFRCYVFYDCTSEVCLKAIAGGLRAPNVGRLVVYFIGHGLQLSDGRVGSVGGVKDEADGRDEAFLFRDRTVTDDVMSKFIVDNYPINMKRRQLVLISDCCHSGSIFDVGSYEGYRRKNIPVISIGACCDHQTAKQDWIDRKGNGVFSHYFWKAVNGGMEGGEVMRYVDGKVGVYGMRGCVERLNC